MTRLVSDILKYALLVAACLSGSSAYAMKVPGNASFNLENYAGKVVYVDFWASWCGPCRASFPFMADLSHEFGDELAVVAINVDENRDDALAFLEMFDAPFEIVYDPEGELAAGFAVPGMPTSYLFDRDGKLLMRHVAFKQSHVESLLKAVDEAVALR